MRLWSLHPQYLDRQGLTACWREGLLAQAVLAGRTKGYRNHPQLIRFRMDTAHDDPGGLITTYLHAIVDEATRRGYSFDRTRILGGPDPALGLGVTDGQLRHEWGHLLAKLTVRSPDTARRWLDVGDVRPHPLFTVVPGPVADWERTSDSARTARTTVTP